MVTALSLLPCYINVARREDAAGPPAAPVPGSRALGATSSAADRILALVDGKLEGKDALGAWQLMSAHENGQCQLWDISRSGAGGGLQPVAVLGTEGPAAKCALPPDLLPDVGHSTCAMVVGLAPCGSAACPMHLIRQPYQLVTLRARSIEIPGWAQSTIKSLKHQAWSVHRALFTCCHLGLWGTAHTDGTIMLRLMPTGAPDERHTVRIGRPDDPVLRLNVPEFRAPFQASLSLSESIFIASVCVTLIVLDLFVTPTSESDARFVCLRVWQCLRKFHICFAEKANRLISTLSIVAAC